MTSTPGGLLGMAALHWPMLATSALLAIAFLVGALSAAWRRVALGSALLLMLGGALSSAAYVVAYEQDDRAGGDAACQGQDQYPPGQPRAPVEGQPQDAAGDGAAAAGGGPAGSGAELVQLRVACQANAVARGALHVQVAGIVGGLVCSCMALIAAFLAVFEYLDRRDRRSAGPRADMLRSADDDGRVKRVDGVDDGHVSGFSGWVTTSLAVVLVLRGVLRPRPSRSPAAQRLSGRLAGAGADRSGEAR